LSWYPPHFLPPPHVRPPPHLHPSTKCSHPWNLSREGAPAIC
jgi:hypothetical protein